MLIACMGQTFNMLYDKLAHAVNYGVFVTVAFVEEAQQTN